MVGFVENNKKSSADPIKQEENELIQQRKADIQVFKFYQFENQFHNVSFTKTVTFKKPFIRECRFCVPP